MLCSGLRIKKYHLFVSIGEVRKSVSLSEYVRKRNGVPLGASGALKCMFVRAFGASSFPRFWNYWNPIWNYFLTRDVLRPVSRVAPMWVAVLVTFVVSGALHDLAISLVKLEFYTFFTPWFALMGTQVILSKKYAIEYQRHRFITRVLFNTLFIAVSFAIIFTAKYFFI